MSNPNIDERLSALIITCTLKPSPAASSSEVIGGQLADFLTAHDVACESVRAVDHVILPGVQKDMGEGDEWPSLREKVLGADILVFVTPTWLGQHSSVAQRVLERLDAELSETDVAGRPILFDKVAVAAVVGNEDGAHHITAVLFQALNDVGFTVPAQGSVYWNGEAMHTTDYKDLEETPEKVSASITTSVTNAIHLAGLLRQSSYPATS
ncbi:flavodoxin family protein [Microbacterium sp.]|uniref:flavodoxin family protein n=1 Tax=Microbacterium sp. TaxID=51671 RepID=UPI003F955FAA